MVLYNRLKEPETNGSFTDHCLVMMIDEYSRWDRVPCNKVDGYTTMCELQLTQYLGSILNHLKNFSQFEPGRKRIHLAMVSLYLNKPIFV